MDIDRTKLIRWWAMVRWFMTVVMFSIGVLHINFQETMHQSVVFLGAFLGIVALNVLFQMQSRLLTTWMVVFQIVLDIVYATIVVHLTGGPASSFVWVYLIGVITASLTVPNTGGIMAGVVGSLSLLLLIVLYRNEILIPSGFSNLDIAGSTVYILSYTGLFCGVALIANYLSDQISLFVSLRKELNQAHLELSSATKEIMECKKKLDQWDDLRPALKDIAHLDHDLNTPLCIISLSLGRVIKMGVETHDEGLQKTGNEITEALNKISQLLLRLDTIKKNPLVGYKKGEI